MELVEKNEKFVRYRFYCEGKKNDVGEVSYNFETKEFNRDIVPPSENGPLSWYTGHAFSRMRKYIEKDEYPETDLVAWY